MSIKLKYDFNSQKFDNSSNDLILNYVICATPRSGSTLLAKGLQSTNIAGLPHEYFNIDHQSDYLKRWDFKELEDYIGLLQKHRVSSNGIFGFKIHYNQYVETFDKKNLSSYFNNLNYIFITREDKIMQGISLEKAMQTQKWSSEFIPIRKSRFNYKGIKNRIDTINSQESNWLKYFRTYGIKPYIVRYEDLEQKYELTIKEVLEFLKIEDKYVIHPKKLFKQRNFSNYLWKLNYNLMSKFKN